MGVEARMRLSPIDILANEEPMFMMDSEPWYRGCWKRWYEDNCNRRLPEKIQRSELVGLRDGR